MKKSHSVAPSAPGYDREELWAHEHNQKLLEGLKRSNVLPFRPRSEARQPAAKSSIRTQKKAA